MTVVKVIRMSVKVGLVCGAEHRENMMHAAWLTSTTTVGVSVRAGTEASFDRHDNREKNILHVNYLHRYINWTISSADMPCSELSKRSSVSLLVSCVGKKTYRVSHVVNMQTLHFCFVVE